MSSEREGLLRDAEQAAEVFLDHAAARVDSPAVEAASLRRVERAWKAVGDHADSPELMALREQALARARRANARRWSIPVNFARRRYFHKAAAVAGVAILVGVAWQLSPFAFETGIHQTSIGEQRIIELDDRSRVILDASTRLRVDFSPEARIVDIVSGQAQFSVAKDQARPFKVRVGDRTFVALGTVFNVDYFGSEIRLTMLEGRVAVLEDALEVSAGQGVLIRDGRASIVPKADMDAVTAWRQGKVVFHAEPLGEAARRLNRYSRLQLEVQDPALAALDVSGVFEAGDARAFVEAVQSYLPVKAEQVRADTLVLRLVR